MWSGGPFPPEFPPPLVVARALQRPRSRGRLRLRSAYPLEQPDIQVNYFDDPEDMRRMIDGVRLGWRLMHQPKIASGWQGPIVQYDRADSGANHGTFGSALADFVRSDCLSICWHRKDGARIRRIGGGR